MHKKDLFIPKKQLATKHTEKNHSTFNIEEFVKSRHSAGMTVSRYYRTSYKPVNIAPKEEMNNRGLTLVELIVVISVIAALATALGFSYVDWMGKYKVEKATKELYADLMNARSMAMTGSCDHFVDFNFPEPPEGCGTYRMAEDTDGDGEGDDDSDGIIDAAGQTFLPPFAKTVEYTIENNFEDKIINFDKRGLVQPRGQALGGTICFFTDNDPDYDCIVISQTRINMGKLGKQPGNGGICNKDNCDTK